MGVLEKMRVRHISRRHELVPVPTPGMNDSVMYFNTVSLHRGPRKQGLPLIS